MWGQIVQEVHGPSLASIVESDITLDVVMLNENEAFPFMAICRGLVALRTFGASLVSSESSESSIGILFTL
jgi:hypothetical protein